MEQPVREQDQPRDLYKSRPHQRPLWKQMWASYLHWGRPIKNKGVTAKGSVLSQRPLWDQSQGRDLCGTRLNPGKTVETSQASNLCWSRDKPASTLGKTPQQEDMYEGATVQGAGLSHWPHREQALARDICRNKPKLVAFNWPEPVTFARAGQRQQCPQGQVQQSGCQWSRPKEDISAVPGLSQGPLQKQGWIEPVITVQAGKNDHRYFRMTTRSSKWPAGTLKSKWSPEWL